MARTLTDGRVSGKVWPMLKVRLQRVGRKNDPSFRVVVVDSHKGPQSGQYLEMLGSYNPRQKTVSLKAERITHWISNGAQVSDTVHNILVKENVIKGKKVNVLPKKSPIVKESTEDLPAEASAQAGEAAAPAAEASAETPAEAPAEEAPADEPVPADEPAPAEEAEAPEPAPSEEPVPEETTEETKEEAA